MESWKILASKDLKEMHKLLDEQFGFKGKLEYAFLRSAKDNIYMLSRDVAKVDWKQLRITAAGMYFAEWRQGIRLSIEGSQQVGPHCTKNVLEISSVDAILWLKGNDIYAPPDYKGLVILKCGKDFYGCGSVKNGVVLNFVPKIRRLPPNA